MGSTSTEKGSAELQAEYDALPSRRSREGVALRKAIARAKEAEGSDAGAPTPQQEADVKAGIKVDNDAPEAAIPDTVGTTAAVVPEALELVDDPQEEPEPDWRLEASGDEAGDEMGILPDLRTLQSTEKTAVYWLGVIPGNADTGEGVPPMHQIDGIGGGIGFYEWWTPHEGKGQDGSDRRGQLAGHLMELSETQVVQLREGLRSSVVRWRQREGFHAHGYIVRIPQIDTIDSLKTRLGLSDPEVARIKVRAQAFRIEEGDEPVARYIYCVKVEGPEAVAGGRWRPSTTLPPSIEQVGAIEGP
jgi:hypothetical protein